MAEDCTCRLCQECKLLPKIISYEAENMHVSIYLECMDVHKPEKWRHPDVRNGLKKISVELIAECREWIPKSNPKAQEMFVPFQDTFLRIHIRFSHNLTKSIKKMFYPF